MQVLQRLDSALIDRGILPTGSSAVTASGPASPMRAATSSRSVPPPVEATARFGDAGAVWTQARLDLEMGVLRWLLDRLFEETHQLDDDSAATLLRVYTVSRVSGKMEGEIEGGAGGWVRCGTENGGGERKRAI